MNDRIWRCSILNLVRTDGTPLAVAGVIECTAIGELTIRAVLQGDRRAEFQDIQTITGMTEDGFSLTAQGGYIKLAEFHTIDESTTLEFGPLECDLVKVGSAPPDRLRWLVNGAHIIGRCKFDHDGHKYILSYIGNPNDRRPGAIRVALEANFTGDVTPVLILLSLAQRSLVAAPIRESYAGAELVAVTLLPSDHPGRPSNPLIPWTPTELSAFFSQALPMYARVGTPYELSRLISYYCLSVQDQNAEVKFILAGVLMEAFKFYWALNVAGKKAVIKGSSGLVKGFEKGVGPKGQPIFYTFEELLDEACSSVGYSTTFTFIEDRNALFHTGAPGDYQRTGGSSWAAIKPELTILYRQIDDILLRILDYKGPILRWDDPETEVMFP